MLIWVLLTLSEEGLACSVPAGWVGIQQETGSLPKSHCLLLPLWEQNAVRSWLALRGKVKQGAGTISNRWLKGIEPPWCAHFSHCSRNKVWPLSTPAVLNYPFSDFQHKRLPYPIAYTLYLLYSSKSYLRDYHCSFYFPQKELNERE